MIMIIVEPMIIFAGQANDAIDLYVKAFGATVKKKLKFSDADPEDWQSKEEDKDLIYHAQIKIGEQIILFADDADAVRNGVIKTTGNSFLIDLLVNFDSDEELKNAYDILSDGGTITSPLMSQTYCSLTCALIDKFGGRWQLMSGYYK
jgi:PhnB protein